MKTVCTITFEIDTDDPGIAADVARIMALCNTDVKIGGFSVKGPFDIEERRASKRLASPDRAARLAVAAAAGSTQRAPSRRPK